MLDFMVELKKCLDKIDGDYVEIFYEDKHANIFERNDFDEKVSEEKSSGLQLTIEKGKKSTIKSKESRDKGRLISFLRNFEGIDEHEKNLKIEFKKTEINTSFISRIETIKSLLRDKRIDEIFIKNEKSYVIIISNEGKYEKDERELTAISFKKYIKNRKIKVESSSVLPNSMDDEILKKEINECLSEIERLSQFYEGDAYKISGELKAVLSPKATSFILNETMGHLLEADLNYKTNIVSLLNEKILNEKITIIEKGPKNEYLKVDDEGEPPKNLLLLEKGRLVNLLTNRKTSLEYNLKRSGNGRRFNFRCKPIVGVHTLSLMEGDIEEEEMISNVAFGVYINRISDGFISLTKRLFSFPIVEGFIIRDGKLCEPLFGVQMRGDFFEFLNNVKLIGKRKETSGVFRKKGKQFYLTFEEAPALYIEKLIIN